MNAAVTLVVAVALIVAIFGSLLRESLRGLSRSRLDEACRRLRKPDRYAAVLKRAVDALIAVDLLTNLAILAVAGIAAMRISAELVDLSTWGRVATVWVEIAVLLLGLLLALFILPWTLARAMGERLVARCWPLLRGLIKVAKPYVLLVKRADRFSHRLWGVNQPQAGQSETIADEIRAVIEHGRREGVISPQARRMIDRVIELQHDDVAGVMTQRADMDCIPVEAPLEEARQLMLEAGHSRMPVIGASTDDIVGILYAKDLLRRIPLGDGATSLRELVREPVFVPETTSIDKLLENMKRRGVHIAIVLDEYSGVSGLVTMEDLLEKIVGEIVDEFDSAEDSGIRQIAPGVLEVEAWVRIDDLVEQFGFDLPEDEDFDSIGGLLYWQLGRIPRRRDMISWKQLRLTVLGADRRRVHKILVELLPIPAGAATQTA